jgi:hypothetical protein
MVHREGSDLVTGFDFSHVERVAWQRRAAAELARILDAHRDLPLIAWTVGAAGSVLVGQVVLSGPRSRSIFDAWVGAMDLPERHERTGDTATYLSGKDHRNGVRIVLLADLLDEAGGQP